MLGAGSDGIDPSGDGFGISVDRSFFSLPAAAFSSRNGRSWRYRDATGSASTPPGLTKVALRRRANGALRLSVKGRDLDLGSLHGTDDRSVEIDADIGNDRMDDAVATERSASGGLSGP